MIAPCKPEGDEFETVSAYPYPAGACRRPASGARQRRERRRVGRTRHLDRPADWWIVAQRAADDDRATGGLAAGHGHCGERSEERRVGKECVRTCRSQGAPDN